MKPTPYRPWQRFSDWYHGWRDGLAGLPPRPTRRQPVPNPPTTPHREYLIRTGQHWFAGEHMRLRAIEAPVLDMLDAIGLRVRTAKKDLAEREAQLADVTAEWNERALNRRLPGEESVHPETVRKRRERERDRAIAAAIALVAEARKAANRAESEFASTERVLERRRDEARMRIERLHEHLHRRMAAYRRRLVQVHPNGSWVNDQMGFDRPEIPGWAEPRKTASAEPIRPPAPAPPPDPDPRSRIIPIHARLVLGSESPPADVLVANADVTPEHCVITRDGDAFKLRASDEGAPVYVDDTVVHRRTMRPGDAFELAGAHYEFTEDGEGLIPSTPECDLIVHALGAAGRLTGMSLVQREGSVLVVLGPSGAGKTSLFAALTGELKTEQGGRAFFKGKRLGPHTDQIRDMLGFVPQSDDVHRSLTVRRLLEYALRLRPGGHRNRAAREARILDTCRHLGLTAQVDQLVATLSGGQRRRVSIGVDMIAGPDLLMLDEPTSGLDPGMDEVIMEQLRAYASPQDGSPRRTVIVVTHSTEHLSPDDTVLVVARPGRPVYCGPPGEPLRQALGVKSYAELMRRLGDEDEADAFADAYRRGLRAAEAEREADTAEALAPQTRPATWWRGLWTFTRQIPVLLHRQAHLVATRGLTKNRRDSFWETPKATASAMLPLIVAGFGAALAALVSADTGLSDPGTPGANGQVRTALNLLVTLSILGGQALTYNDLVADYPMIKREYRTGVRVRAVLLSKWLVFALVAALQSATAAAIYVWLAPGPDHSHVFGPAFELGVNLSVTAIAAMTLGLAISALAKKVETAVAVATGTSIVQVALNGATVDLSGIAYLDVISRFFPARQGLAAIASSIQYEQIAPLADDPMWEASTGRWAESLILLAALTAFYACFAERALARRLRAPE